eukprot:Nk52_evm36s223 gene=Nk52_evmTU36s223
MSQKHQRLYDDDFGPDDTVRPTNSDLPPEKNSLQRIVTNKIFIVIFCLIALAVVIGVVVYFATKDDGNGTTDKKVPTQDSDCLEGQKVSAGACVNITESRSAPTLKMTLAQPDPPFAKQELKDKAFSTNNPKAEEIEKVDLKELKQAPADITKSGKKLEELNIPTPNGNTKESRPTTRTDKPLSQEDAEAENADWDRYYKEHIKAIKNFGGTDVDSSNKLFSGVISEDVNDHLLKVKDLVSSVVPKGKIKHFYKSQDSKESGEGIANDKQTKTLPVALLKSKVAEQEKEAAKKNSTKLAPYLDENGENFCARKPAIAVSNNSYTSHFCKACPKGSKLYPLRNLCSTEKYLCRLPYKEPVMLGADKDPDFYSSQPVKFECLSKCRKFKNHYMKPDGSCAPCDQNSNSLYNHCHPKPDLCKKFEDIRNFMTESESEDAYFSDATETSAYELSIDQDKQTLIMYGCIHKCVKGGFENSFYNMKTKKCQHCINGGILNAKTNKCEVGENTCSHRDWLMPDPDKNHHQSFTKGHKAQCIHRCEGVTDEDNNTFIWFSDRNKCMPCYDSRADFEKNQCIPDPEFCPEHTVFDASVTPSTYHPITNRYKCLNECNPDQVKYKGTCHDCTDKQFGYVDGYTCKPKDDACPKHMVVDQEKTNVDNWDPVSNPYKCTYTCPYHGHYNHVHRGGSCIECSHLTEVNVKENKCEIVQGRCKHPWHEVVSVNEDGLEFTCMHKCRDQGNKYWSTEEKRCVECKDTHFVSRTQNKCKARKPRCFNDFEGLFFDEEKDEYKCIHRCTRENEILHFRIQNAKLVDWCFPCGTFGVANRETNACVIHEDACPPHMYVPADVFPLRCVHKCQTHNRICNAVWEDDICKECGEFARLNKEKNTCEPVPGKCDGAHEFLDASQFPHPCKSHCEQGEIYLPGKRKCVPCDPNTSTINMKKNECMPHITCDSKSHEELVQEIKSNISIGYRCGHRCRHAKDSYWSDKDKGCVKCHAYEYLNSEDNTCYHKCKDNFNSVWTELDFFGVGLGMGNCVACQGHEVASPDNTCVPKCREGTIFKANFGISILGGECVPCELTQIANRHKNECIEMAEADIHQPVVIEAGAGIHAVEK